MLISHYSYSMMLQVIFTDETTIEINSTHRSLVRKGRHDPLTEAHFQPRRSFPQEIMFWGCVSVFGTGPLVPVQGTMASAEYVNMIATSLLPIAEAWFGNEDWIL